MTDVQIRETREAVAAADDALYHLQRARKCLGSAGNWGLLDIFGGNIVSGLMKHGRMAEAEREVGEAKHSLQKFSRELRDVEGYSAIHINDFLTFADFFFDGVIMDWLVQSKISNAKRQCDDAIRQVEQIKARLEDILRGQVQ